LGLAFLTRSRVSQGALPSEKETRQFMEREMDPRKTAKIKNAVRKNFEESPDHYQTFEDSHGFFKKLTETLLVHMNLARGADVLDIGCGTGSSTAQILQAVPESRVWGLDNSPAMLRAARSRIGESDRLRFIEGDAAALPGHFAFQFDAIVYTASIFLIPDYRESLKQAQGLLKQGGKVGLTFMDGVYDVQLKNALAIADREACEGVSLKKPVNLSEFHAFFGSLFPRRDSWQDDMRLSRDVLQEFFSVPAMSAGLFPGLPYAERVKKVARLFDHLPKTEIFFRWIIMVGAAT